MRNRELDTPPVPPSQEELWSIVDQIRTVYTNPGQSMVGHFLKSWKIPYNGSLGRYDTLTIATPDREIPQFLLYNPIRITLSKGRDHEARGIGFKIEQNTKGILQIHQETLDADKRSELIDRLNELHVTETQGIDSVVKDFSRKHEEKREWERGSGQAFVNSEEARELLKILGGKKVPYAARGIFIGQKFIGIK